MAKQFIVLHGLASSGKTTTLRHVVESLTGLKLPKKPQNWRVVFQYHGLTIALSTFGDKPKDIQNNLNFFDGKWKNRITVYYVDLCKKQVTSENQLASFNFDVCISACRIEEDMQNVQLFENYIRSKGVVQDVQWIYKPRSTSKLQFPLPNHEDILTAIRIINSINK